MKPTDIDRKDEDDEFYSDPYCSDVSCADPHYNISETSSSSEDESGSANNMNIMPKTNKLKLRKVTQQLKQCKRRKVRRNA